MEFNTPQSVALIKHEDSGNIYIYKKGDVIYFNDGKKIGMVRILRISDNILVVNKNEGGIICWSKNEYLSDSQNFKFLKGVNIDKIRFSYIYGFNDEPRFKFLKINKGTLTLCRNYKSDRRVDSFRKELFKQVKVIKSNQDKIIINKDSITPIIKKAEIMVKYMIDEVEDKKKEKHQILNLKMDSSLAKIVLGSWGVTVKKIFLKKIPEKIDLREGDLIKRINHKPINNLQDVYRVLKKINSSKNVVELEVDLIRNYRLVKKYFEIR